MAVRIDFVVACPIMKDFMKVRYKVHRLILINEVRGVASFTYLYEKTYKGSEQESV